MRCKITLSYNGAYFSGSQRQCEQTPTVLGTLSTALHRLGIDTDIVASGRTDRGVHATAQVLHVDLPPFWRDLEKFKQTLSYQLPSSIHISKVEAVSSNFHARYSATKRRYRYIMSERTPNPFEADFVTFIPQVNFKRIQNALTLFEGTHNFEMFKKSGSPTRTFERTIYKTRAYRHQGYIILTFEANGFLRSQIRLMVAFLLEIGKGTLGVPELLEQLTCKKLHLSRPAPQNGLYLAGIQYKS